MKTLHLGRALSARSLIHLTTGAAAMLFLVACGGSDSNNESPNSYKVTAEAGAGGTVAPTTQQVESGDTATVQVTPNTGYEIDTVSGCGGSLNNTTYTTGTITGDCKVTASFSKKSYTVSTSVNMGGTWSPNEQSVEHGDTTSFTLSWDATAFRFVSAQGCAGSFDAGTFTTGAITSSCTVSAEFEANQAPTVNAGDDSTATSGDTV